MGKRLKIVSSLVNLWACISPVLAAIYLIVWTVQFADMQKFWGIDMYIGFLPKIFNILFPVYVEYHGIQIIMSYVHCAGFLIITTFIAFKYQRMIFKMQRKNEDDELQEKIKLFEERKEEIPKESKLPIEKINHFYSLFELKLEYYNPINKSLDDLEKLKKEYSKILVEKLKVKYPKVKFSVSDKIFIYCEDFSLINEFCDDITKLYKIFYEIDYDKLIKTDLLLSFWTDFKKVDMKTALKIMNGINKLNYWNKIVVNDKFAKRYELESKVYDLISLGPARLDVQYNDKNELDIDLFYLKK